MWAPSFEFSFQKWWRFESKMNRNTTTTMSCPCRFPYREKSSWSKTNWSLTVYRKLRTRRSSKNYWCWAVGLRSPQLLEKLWLSSDDWWAFWKAGEKKIATHLWQRYGPVIVQNWLCHRSPSTRTCTIFENWWEFERWWWHHRHEPIGAAGDDLRPCVESITP